MSSLLLLIIGAIAGSAFMIVAERRGWFKGSLDSYKDWVDKTYTNYEERKEQNDSGEERTESESEGRDGTDGGEDQLNAGSGTTEGLSNNSVESS